jgi:hypothetical protein
MQHPGEPLRLLLEVGGASHVVNRPGQQPLVVVPSSLGGGFTVPLEVFGEFEQVPRGDRVSERDEWGNSAIDVRHRRRGWTAEWPDTHSATTS